MKYGITPEQFLDLKALKGDSSDNIPGVPGIGEKGAIELLKAHKTLDGVYDNLALIKETTRKKLEAGKDLAYLSKKLAAIWTDAPLKLDLAEVDGSKCKPEDVRDVLQKLEFRTLVRQLPEAMQVQEHHTASHGIAADLKPGKNVLIDSDANLAKLELNNAKQLYAHSRTAGKHGRRPELLILSTEGDQTYTLNLKKLSKKAVTAKLKDLPPLVGYDLKSTLKVFIELGLPMPIIEHDVLIGAFLLNCLRREQTLSELAGADLGYEGATLEDLPTNELMERANELVAVIRALYEQQAKDMANTPKLPELASQVEWPVIPVLAAMEYEGIKLDTGYLNKMSVELADQISDVEQHDTGALTGATRIVPCETRPPRVTALPTPRISLHQRRTPFAQTPQTNGTPPWFNAPDPCFRTRTSCL